MHSVRVTSLSITCTVLALLLLLLSAISERMYTFQIDLAGSDIGPNDNAAIAQHQSSVASNLILASSYAHSLHLQSAAGAAAGAADGLSLPQDTEGLSLHSEWNLGLFSFCYDFRLSTTSGNQTLFALDLPKQCQIVRTADCSVSFLPLFQAIWEMTGQAQNQTLPADLVAQVDDVVLLDQCSQYIASRSFVLLGILAALLGGLGHVLKWRGKINLGGVVAMMGMMSQCDASSLRAHSRAATP